MPARLVVYPADGHQPGSPTDDKTRSASCRQRSHRRCPPQPPRRRPGGRPAAPSWPGRRCPGGQLVLIGLGPTPNDAFTPSTPWTVTTPRYWVMVRPSIPGVVVMSIAILLQRSRRSVGLGPRLDGGRLAVNRRRSGRTDVDALNQGLGAQRSDPNPRPSDSESDARRRPGRLPTDLACSRWMARRPRRTPTDPERSSGGSSG
jgi:hypothetical protein